MNITSIHVSHNNIRVYYLFGSIEVYADFTMEWEYTGGSMKECHDSDKIASAAIAYLMRADRKGDVLEDVQKVIDHLGK